MSGVSKRFRLHHNRVHSLKEKVIFWRNRQHDDFWALQDVTFSVPRGVTIGLIGRNGSGKSTLLKVISRILYPESGSLRVNGRVSTLLELGAGFHPDFTGRENIYLNASILGLGRREIDQRLDDIIAFADLGDFIDNPVRNYSSGMYMRLGFSVAVHVDPDILLVDEVLAVGDVAFQEKCMHRIDSMKRRGTTIIMVSHSAKQIKDLCSQAIWLEKGQIRAAGDASGVASQYEQFMHA